MCWSSALTAAGVVSPATFVRSAFRPDWSAEMSPSSVVLWDDDRCFAFCTVTLCALSAASRPSMRAMTTFLAASSRVSAYAGVALSASVAVTATAAAMMFLVFIGNLLAVGLELAVYLVEESVDVVELVVDVGLDGFWRVSGRGRADGRRGGLRGRRRLRLGPVAAGEQGETERAEGQRGRQGSLHSRDGGMRTFGPRVGRRKRSVREHTDRHDTGLSHRHG